MEISTTTPCNFGNLCSPSLLLQHPAELCHSSLETFFSFCSRILRCHLADCTIAISRGTNVSVQANRMFSSEKTLDLVPLATYRQVHSLSSGL